MHRWFQSKQPKAPAAGMSMATMGNVAPVIGMDSSNGCRASPTGAMEHDDSRPLRKMQTGLQPRWATFFHREVLVNQRGLKEILANYTVGRSLAARILHLGHSGRAR